MMENSSIRPTPEELEHGVIRLGMPSSGRLATDAMTIFKGAELPVERLSERINYGKGKRWDDLRAFFMRPDDIATFTAHGALDLGITAQNLVEEKQVADDVEVVMEFDFGKCAVVLAAPAGTSLSDLKDGLIATSHPNIARRFFAGKNITGVEIVEGRGAIEAFPSLGLAHGIVDITETGTSLRENGLEILASIMNTRAILVASKLLTPAQQENIRFIKKSLEGGIEAQKMSKLICRVPNTPQAKASFQAIINFYSTPMRNYIKSVDQITSEGSLVRFEILCLKSAVSKLFKVLTQGRNGEDKILRPVEGIQGEINDSVTLIF